MKTLFLINNRSGAKRSFDIRALIEDTCRDWPHPFHLHGCDRKEDLDGIIDAASEDGFGIVYAVGGDGTVHEIAKRLVGRTLALGILPIGSGNGFARHIGLPMDPRASLVSCLQRRVEVIDTAVASGSPFLGIMGIGFDALIADRFAASSVRGLKTYVQIGLSSYASYKPEEYELTIDGQRSVHKAWVIAIANASQYGNDARVAPLASLQDGLLDVVIIERPSLLNAPFMLRDLFTGNLHRQPTVTMMQGREIHIVREAAGPAHLDGEPVTMGTELRISVQPQSLRVVVPDAMGQI